MEIVREPAEVRRWVRERRARGERIGFVPTMGYLHRGHTSLVDIARSRAEAVVVSIYVNPLQFAPGEDLDRYPRDPEGDAEKCRAHGVGLLFTPEDLYEPGHATTVHVAGLTEGLCGAHRPGHFDGVTTVVARLLGIVQPDLAVFGEKDYQQLVVVRRMVRDLAIPTEIVAGPLVRDDDGLALSSRNAYLSPEERRRALSLHRALFRMAEAAAAGERDVARLVELGRAALDVDRLDYIEVRAADDLAPLEVLDRPARALVAAHVGRTRLIDNLALEPR